MENESKREIEFIGAGAASLLKKKKQNNRHKVQSLFG